MRLLPFLQGTVSPIRYATLAPALLLSQHLAVALVFRARGQRLAADAEFWLLPLRRLAELPNLPSWLAAAAFVFSLAVAWGLAMLSFRRAAWSGGGHTVAAFSIVPGIQAAAVLVLAILPVLPVSRDAPLADAKGATIVRGVLAGMAIIVGAVLISAVGFGSYGWGLFVLTPFLVGVTTAYLANRGQELSWGRTLRLVLWAAAFGTLALVGFALEGIVCILLAAPLGALAAMAGGAFGRAIARTGRNRGTPLMSVAVLPALFAVESAMPPMLVLDASQHVDIAAPSSAVWQAVTSDAPIGSSPGLVAAAGLAYPIRARLLGRGVGSTRLGVFSTGIAVERVTDWSPRRRLAFAVLRQPPSMDEASPYAHVHAPHDLGYFVTTRTSFDLSPLPTGGTRLTVHAAHVLRIDPVLYWEPLARWAIHANVTRVLTSIKAQAEQAALRTAADPQLFSEPPSRHSAMTFGEGI